MDQKTLDTLISLDLGFSVLLDAIKQDSPELSQRLASGFATLAAETPPEMRGVSAKLAAWSDRLKATVATH
ncbi:MAG: hypothetical protein KZQ93_15945 [Candidatus Thiodiazotropha sp. (ex Monitilora ramsayi)]|nr:hypothetical protein [Candidatus Thiodiazotropha sp. (ex Monitilora ramsayi)]